VNGRIAGAVVVAEPSQPAPKRDVFACACDIHEYHKHVYEYSAHGEACRKTGMSQRPPRSLRFSRPWRGVAPGLQEGNAEEDAMRAGDKLVLETMVLERPSPGVVVLTLNRPDRLNAMTMRMFDELMDVPQALKLEDELRVVIMTGAGRGFCSGYDLANIDEITRLGIRNFLKFQELAAGGLAALRALRVPVIAAVNGPATGGGLALALVADIRLAAPEATFNAAFVKIGLSCGELGTSWALSRLVGSGLASEIAFTGRFVDAEEAARIGLVNRVCAPGALMSDALAMARQIGANSPGGVQLSKRALQASLEIPSYAAAMEMENRGQALLSRGQDMLEALAAFKEKRPANFTGN